MNTPLQGVKSRNALLPFKTEEEVIACFKAIDASTAPKLAALFGRTSKAALDIRPVDKLTRNTASSHYIFPTVDGARVAVFYAAIADPLKFTSHDMTSLFYMRVGLVITFKWRYSKSWMYRVFDVTRGIPRMVKAGLCMQKA